MVRSITLEEHFSSRAVKEEIAAAGGDPLEGFPKHIGDRLADLDDVRLQDMDENDVEIQVISHTPANHASPKSISAANDELAVAVKKHPKRYAGFAVLPMAHPEAAAKELERCVKELGFVGALVDNHTNGLFYDGDQHDQFWAKAQELDVPIYLHPTWPSDDMVKASYSGGGLEGRAAEAMAIGAFGFGWHVECGIHFLRLLAARVFEKYPKVKVVLGHSGELVPYMFKRIDKATGRWGLKRSFAEVMHNNVWITTSGMFDTNSLRCLLGVMPHDRIMLSVDYPFSMNALGKEYLEEIKKEGIMNDEQVDAFAYSNAKKFLFER